MRTTHELRSVPPPCKSISPQVNRRERSHAAPLRSSLLLLAGCAALAADDAKPIAIAEVKHDGPVNFEKEILPMLTKNCLACHNAQEGRKLAGARNAAVDSQRGRLGPGGRGQARAARACC